jgi:hypothetical protein
LMKTEDPRVLQNYITQKQENWYKITEPNLLVCKIK